MKKANACTNFDLKRMIYYLYSNACSSSDYQDAALRCFLRYLFGRASDLTLVHKQNVSIDASDVFFVRFIRMKACEEQGLSIFLTNDFSTCPLPTIALALVTQAAPCDDLLDILPAQPGNIAVRFGPETPLIDVLDHPEASCGVQAADTSGTDSPPSTHSHVNRLLDRVATRDRVEQQLTSHSFRRGGAQHANRSAELATRWIFDRGAWNMSTTNKAFSYVFNIMSEDHKLAKVLSGWKTNEFVPLTDLSLFDAQTNDSIREVQEMLFATCQSLIEKKYNINQRVLDVLTAYLVLYFPLLKEANLNGPAVKRLETCVLESGRTLADLLSWSTHLATSPCAKKHKEDKEELSKNSSTVSDERSSSFATKLLSMITLSDIQDAKKSAWMR